MLIQKNTLVSKTWLLLIKIIKIILIKYLVLKKKKL